MRCRRCHSTMFETSVEAHNSSVQQWFSCPLCAQQAVRTSYQASTTSKSDRSFSEERLSTRNSGTLLS